MRTSSALLLAFLVAPPASAGVLNANEIRGGLGLQQLSQVRAQRTIRVAVLDNGFMGYQAGTRDLVATTELFKGPIESDNFTPHGYGMAQILSAVVGPSREDLVLDLVDANGFTNLKAAVDGVIMRGVDVVLYSQNWEFGGNFDGGGFINAQVNRALDAGILWINAAGNHHNLSFESRVAQAPETLHLDSFVDANEVALTLSWSDFTDSENHKTLKDLDLEIVTPTGEKLPLRNRRQIGQDPSEAEPDLSAHARENFSLTLGRGRYQLRVQNRSGNFGETDRLRLTVTPKNPQAIRLVQATGQAEILAPADNPRVLTVGDCGAMTSQGPTRDGRSKPDVNVNDSRVFLSNGQVTAGSSNAAAMIAGAAALLKARDATFTQDKLLAWTRDLRRSGLSATCNGAPRWRTPSQTELDRLSN